MQDLYKDKLATIDDLMLKAIEAVLDEAIEAAKPTIGDNIPNSLLGEKYRAYEMGKAILKQTLINIKSYRTIRPKAKLFNKER